MLVVSVIAADFRSPGAAEQRRALLGRKVRLKQVRDTDSTLTGGVEFRRVAVRGVQRA